MWIGTELYNGSFGKFYKQNDIDNILSFADEIGVDKIDTAECYNVENIIGNSLKHIHKNLPEYKTQWSVEQGVQQLLKDLEHWKLNKTKFKQREFYRLQQIEYLYNTKQINSNLKFL